MKLSNANENESYIVEDILLDENTRRRLESIAVIKGVEIKVIFQQKSGTVIQVGDTRLALDKEVTSNIILEGEDDSTLKNLTGDLKCPDCGCCKESEGKEND